MTDRPLVLRPARHPFRAALPTTSEVPGRSDDQDIKLFVLSFTAFFICFYSFFM